MMFKQMRMVLSLLIYQMVNIRLDGIWVASEESKWYSLGLVFTVQDGKLVGATELNIDLTVYNVMDHCKKTVKP